MRNGRQQWLPAHNPSQGAPSSWSNPMIGFGDHYEVKQSLSAFLFTVYRGRRRRRGGKNLLWSGCYWLWANQMVPIWVCAVWLVASLCRGTFIMLWREHVLISNGYSEHSTGTAAVLSCSPTHDLAYLCLNACLCKSAELSSSVFPVLRRKSICNSKYTSIKVLVVF